MSIVDTRGRALRDLRISLTDRCNFRCSYCMPREHFPSNYQFLARSEIMSYEEIIFIIDSLMESGLEKVRLTGGEPLLRKDIGKLITGIREIGPDLDIALTTNGILLAKFAQTLADSGLDRVTVSLDALEDEKFQSLSDSEFSVSQVLEGIEAAQQAGLGIKVNSVIKGTVNTDQIIPLAEYFSERKIPLRFIEFMDVGSTNSWNLDEVMSGQEMRVLIENELGPLTPIPPAYKGEVARRWTLKESEVGFIESVTAPFCGDCTRARISAKGSLYTCLFSESGIDLLPILRFGASKKETRQMIQDIWQKRDDNYSEVRGSTERSPIEMSYIGG